MNWGLLVDVATLVAAAVALVLGWKSLEQANTTLSQANETLRLAQQAQGVEVWQATERRYAELRAVAAGDCILTSYLSEKDEKIAPRECGTDRPMTPLQRESWANQYLYLLEEIVVVTEGLPAAIGTPWRSVVKADLRGWFICKYAKETMASERASWYGPFVDLVESSDCAPNELGVPTKFKATLPVRAAGTPTSP